ncbi:MAG TPA: ATP-dependent DNA helicase [Candidatus Nanoarchaeia archaeon]|nr:ATP-dependent DNA helicase [Candidatus Nanoarchaeia archaeon]
MDSSPNLAVKDFFPYPQIRAEQGKLLQDIDSAFQQEKILLAHAPTGLGKTATALSVALHHALEKKKRVLFLTSRHTQHAIAVETLREIKQKGIYFTTIDLVGKRSMCSQEIAGLFGNDFNDFCKTIVGRGECEFYNNVKNKQQLTVEAKKALSDLQQRYPLHNQEIMNFSREEKMCGYEIAIAMAKTATVIIADYNYLFNPFIQQNFFNKLELEMKDVIVIVDEGHNLPARVVDVLSSALNSITIKNAVLEAKKFGFNGMLFWLQELVRILNELVQSSENNFGSVENLVAKDDFMSKVKAVVDYDELINELELAAEEVRRKQKKSYLGGIAAFLEAWKGEDKGFARMLVEKETNYGPVTTLSYQCLDPRIITEPIFKQIFTGVIMSGTLTPLFMYRDILGITRAVEKEYGSPFPPENKLSVVIPETSTKYNLRGEAMFQKIAGMCTEIAALVPGNIAFFFPSYQLRDSIANHLRSPKKLFFEKKEMTTEDKNTFLAEFKAHKNQGGILLGVSGANFAEGVDFPGDLLNGVVVVGLPLGKPDLQTKEIVKYYEEKFGKGWDYGYIYPAMSKCIQSAGRCIRSETDKGAVIYLDERFAWQNYYACLPREGLRVTKEYQGLLKEFFGKN